MFKPSAFREDTSSAVTSAGRGRILVVTPQPFYQDRGTPIAVANTCRALGELGYDVDLLAFPIGEDILIPSVNLCRCPNPVGIREVPIGFSASKALLDVALAGSFGNLLRTRDYRAVHAVEEAAYLAALLCPRFGKPFVYDMASAIPLELRGHKLFGTAVAQRGLRSFERLTLRRASRIVCSMGLADYVRGVAPDAACTEWRFPSLTHAVDDASVRQLRADLHISQEAHVIVYSGNFAAYQGLDLLFEAFTRALPLDPSLMLVCVGASAEARDATLSQFDPRVRSHVRILVRQSRDSMPAYFAMADCLISLRPISNNLPLKVFDYMATGKPIVATKGPAHEPVLNSERAFMCEARSESVKQAILDVFKSAHRARAVASSARSHAMDHYGWNRFIQLVDGLYAGIGRADSWSRSSVN